MSPWGLLVLALTIKTEGMIYEASLREELVCALPDPKTMPI